jgi:hypothetical protein
MIGGRSADASAGKAATGAAPIPNSGAKLSAALAFAFMVTVQLAPIPLHAPLQLLNPQALSGVAVSVTWLPALKVAAQVAPQSIPAGELVTLPLGLPITDTDSV